MDDILKEIEKIKTVILRQPITGDLVPFRIEGRIRRSASSHFYAFFNKPAIYPVCYEVSLFPTEESVEILEYGEEQDWWHLPREFYCTTVEQFNAGLETIVKLHEVAWEGIRPFCMPSSPV